MNPISSDNQGMPADSVPPEKMILSFSSENLMDSVSTDRVFSPDHTHVFLLLTSLFHLSLQGKQRNAETFHREYLTLPTSKPRSNKTPRTTEHPPHIAPSSRDLQKINVMVFVCCISCLFYCRVWYFCFHKLCMSLFESCQTGEAGVSCHAFYSTEYFSRFLKTQTFKSWQKKAREHIHCYSSPLKSGNDNKQIYTKPS